MRQSLVDRQPGRAATEACQDLINRKSIKFHGYVYLFKTKMDAFRSHAKLTQRRYGTSKAAAGLESNQNLCIVPAIASHKRAITTKPPKIERKPKNTTGQRPLRTSWIRKIAKAQRTSFFSLPFCHTIQAATAISV